ncbi:MAG: class D sortase [Bryobacteraceae bacterium]|jgi:sortase A
MRIWIERFLLLAGLVGIGLWLGSVLTNTVWQHWENWVFDREARGEPAAITDYLADKEKSLTELIESWRGSKSSREQGTRRPVVIPDNHLLGRLSIPRLQLTATVREGVGENTLSRALGHIPSTALPGQRGNVGVAGHRDTLFRGLRNIQQNDLIRFETLHGTYLYKVDSTQIVKPEDVSVLNAKQYPELTLVTCYPFYYVGSAPDRFIVKARQVTDVPKDEQLTKTTAEPAPPVYEAKWTKPAARTIHFNVARNHSSELAPGISLGVTETDVPEQRVDGWMWIAAERRTIWLRNQELSEPVIFYDYRDGKRRELRITDVTANSVAGYLMVSD